MSDTSSEIEGKYRAMLLARSGAERLVMGCAMFDDAQRIVISSIRGANPSVGQEELAQEVFLRFYGHEFDADQRERILAQIAAAWRQRQAH